MRLGLGLSVCILGGASLPPPTVSSVSPSFGTVSGGTAITITGTGFRTGATVTVGGSSATSVVVVSATSITCVTPSSGSTGSKNVVVTNSDAQAGTLASGFRYDPAEWASLQPLIHWEVANAVVTTGNDIDSIPNHSHLSANALTGVASNKPQRISASTNFNSHDSASHTSAQRFTCGNPGVAANGSITVVAVAKITGTLNTPFANRLIWLNSGTLEMYGAATTGFWTAGCSTNFAIKTSNDDARSASAVVMLTSGTGASGTQRLYVSSTTEEGNGATNGFDITAGGTIGETSFNFKGEWAEILIFDSIVSSGARSTILNALGTKYGITIS